MVGVYMNPPDFAVVVSFDEKSQIQAWTAPQPSCLTQEVTRAVQPMSQGD